MKPYALILRQAKSVAASLALHSGANFAWENLGNKTRSDLCNIVISFHSLEVKRINAWNICAVHYGTQLYKWVERGSYKVEMYDILMRTTACLAHARADMITELFNVEGDETLKMTLKKDIKWDWVNPEEVE
jgi:hypothetical protein